MAIVRGQLAAGFIPATAATTDVYTVPMGKVADVNVTFFSTTSTPTLLGLAHVKNGTQIDLTVVDYLVFDIPTSAFASPTASLQITGILMSAGDTIVAYTTSSTAVVQVNGIEEDV